MASMHVINAEGRRLSMLNDDSTSHTRPALSWPAVSFAPSYGNYSSASSSPNTPGLLRSESYDSQMSSEAISPTTPEFGYGHYPERAPYEEYSDYASPYMTGTRPHYSDSRAGSYDGESVAGMPAGDKAAKRYPCRYKDSHRCDKTFTTSGHASRHSKIHTAEKAVPCSFEGCTKKFTRADNMKQHLDTHYKEKYPRHSTSSSSSRPSLSSSERRTSTCSKSSSKSKSSSSHGDGCWDMSGLCVPLQTRPSATRNPSAGLDALAMAVACQREA
ncbi:hypothetical protein B0T18DRAFT_424540 [Schizothecium vesticola]|uniref:C2H2 type master regulator of conidiophore development brlA n=1 Tax=Schizothecium vesticola TaxID=314040 RepID=A0AA40FAJ1_9PEZI|nr:hypothetical protein B0T18DRAFT_424540 [Schizothecium vesticola]